MYVHVHVHVCHQLHSICSTYVKYDYALTRGALFTWLRVETPKMKQKGSPRWKNSPSSMDNTLNEMLCTPALIPLGHTNVDGLEAVHVFSSSCWLGLKLIPQPKCPVLQSHSDPHITSLILGGRNKGGRVKRSSSRTVRSHNLPLRCGSTLLWQAAPSLQSMHG
jgi:hypothetical protein